MHFAKWMRKNTKKIMVFVVIFSMVSFVIGYTGLQLFFSFFGGDTQLIGKYDGGRVRAREYRAAQNELQLLRMLGADRLLLAQGQRGLSGPLLTHLLFPDSPFAGDMGAQLKQAAQSGQLPVDVETVEAFFGERNQPELMWILLQAEAVNAGSRVSDETARQLLRQILPHLAEGADAGQVINTIIAQAHVTEDQLVSTFAELLGVIFYTSAVTDNQAVTLNQIQAFIGRGQERFDAEYVKFDAEQFIKPDEAITDAQSEQQFQTYRDVLPGTISEDNPLGFGYMLPKRVRLEYMAVLLDDVKTQIERPTAESMEDFYSRNIERFRDEEPVDPNNPEGEKITKTRTFAESLPQIRNQLEQERINRLANQIFGEARRIVEQGFSAINFDEAVFEQLQAAAGDYQQAATELSGRYRIAVLTGQTGLLSAEDFAQDEILQRLQMQHGMTAVPLSEIAFAVQVDAKDDRRRIGVPVIRPWENIGPINGGYFDEAAGQYNRLMTMVRIVDVKEAAVPETMDISYSTQGMVLHPEQRQDEAATTFSLTEKVASDIRLVRAMDTARQNSRRLAALAEELGWEKAIDAYNAEYAADEHAVKAALQTSKAQMRMSKADIERTRNYMAAHPASAPYIKTRLETGMLNDQIYTLLPNSEETTGTIHEVIDVKPARTSCVVKRVTRIPATEKDYLENKVMTSLQLGTIDTAALAMLHLKPENLFARMNYVSEQTPIMEAEEPILPPAEGF